MRLQARYDDINETTITQERVDVLRRYADGKTVRRPGEACLGDIGPTAEGRQLARNELMRRGL